MNKRKNLSDFPAGPVVKKSAFLMQETWVRSLVWEEPTEQLSLCTTSTEPVC